MKSFIETGVIIAACGSAIFWFTSAMCRLPGIKPGKDELDTVTELSKALQRMNRWNLGRRTDGRNRLAVSVG
jgi:hypothetical protein